MDLSQKHRAFIWAVKHLLEKDGWGSRSALAAASGLSSGYLSEILNWKKPPSERARDKIARGLGTNEETLIQLGRRLLAEASGERPRDPLEALAGPLRPVPIFDANCGGDNGIVWTDGGLPVGQGLETIELPVAWLNENSFCLRVHNDSMEPTLQEGDVVLVNPHASVENGDIVFARLPNGEKLIKRYRRPEDQEVIILESDNRRYPPIVLTPDNGDGAKMHKVVSLVRRTL